MKEFINHPQVTRIFKAEIQQYGIKSILADANSFTIEQYNGYMKLPFDLHKYINYAVITALCEDELPNPHETETETINKAIEYRQKYH